MPIRNSKRSTDTNLSDQEAAAWQLYWQTRCSRLKFPEGKRYAVTAASDLLDEMREHSDGPFKIAELGCGEGHLLGLLGSAHPKCSFIGIDFRQSVIEKAREIYPQVEFINADYASNDLKECVKEVDIIMLVNTLHEVFSASVNSSVRNRVSIGKKKIAKTLENIVYSLAGGGYIILFDGVEHSSLDERVVIRFLRDEGLQGFLAFAEEYKALPITYENLDSALQVQMSMRDFTRYITKSIFLNTSLWQIEKLESYQYFTASEFKSVLGALDFEIVVEKFLSPSRVFWEKLVRIETPGIDFPDEHILLVGQLT